MNLDYEAGFRAGKRDAHKAMERRIAEAVAAERIQIANAFEEFVKYLARDWGRYLSGDGPVIMESIATRVEREAAAIREGGEHG